MLSTYGGHGWKQRYHVKIGNNHYILPIQWNQATSRWVAYNLQNWYKEDGSLREPAMRASFDQDCAGCHNTGLQLKKVDGGYESSYVELNTGCERCHGPGSNHVKAPKTKGSIINPKGLPYERSLEVCGQCHSRGVSQPSGTFGFPWNDKDNKPYIPGEVLANYYQFKPGMWPAAESTTLAHSRSHHQQWHDLLKSKHFANKVTCQDCHNPHGGPGRFQMIRADFNNSLCLGCHGKDKRFSSPGAIMKHTKHAYSPEAQGLSRCSSCHMVKTASSAEGGDVHSHDFKIVKPAESLAMFKKGPEERGGQLLQWYATRIGQRTKRVTALVLAPTTRCSGRSSVIGRSLFRGAWSSCEAAPLVRSAIRRPGAPSPGNLAAGLIFAQDARSIIRPALEALCEKARPARYNHLPRDRVCGRHGRYVQEDHRGCAIVRGCAAARDPAAFQGQPTSQLRGDRPLRGGSAGHRFHR